MEVTSEQKNKIKSLLSCLKKAGVDFSQKPKAKIQPDQAQMNITIKGENQAINLNFETGDVEYEYFTTKRKLGNIENIDGLVSGIKQAFFKENDIKPNDDSEPDVYEQFKIRLKEAIRKHINVYLDEMSTTGNGSSFTTGNGENYATPFSFVGGHRDKNKFRPTLGMKALRKKKK